MGSTDRVVVPDSESLYLKKAWTLTAWVLVNSAEEQLRFCYYQKNR